MRTSFSVCNRKRRYRTESDAVAAATGIAITLNTYRCALCREFHLTSRTKGMFTGAKSDKAAP